MKTIYGNRSIDAKNVRQSVPCAEKSCCVGKMIGLLMRSKNTRPQPISVTHEKNQRIVDASIQEDSELSKKDIALKLNIFYKKLKEALKGQYCSSNAKVEVDVRKLDQK